MLQSKVPYKVDVNRLEKWPSRKLMNFSTGKHRVIEWQTPGIE